MKVTNATPLCRPTGQVCYFKKMFHGTNRIVFLDLFSLQKLIIQDSITQNQQRDLRQYESYGYQAYIDKIFLVVLEASNHVKLYLLFMFKVGRNLSLLNWMKSQRFYTYTLEEQRNCRKTAKMSKTC